MNLTGQYETNRTELIELVKLNYSESKIGAQFDCSEIDSLVCRLDRKSRWLEMH